MKTTLHKVSNGLRYKIKIRLNDECKNGHDNFAITGEVWPAGVRLTDRNMLHCGEIGEKIAAAFPELTIFSKMHLSDADGAPLYALEKGMCHMKEPVIAMDCLRINEKEYNALAVAGKDKQYFSYMLERLGIVDRWKKEAQEAIALLEELSGEEYTYYNERPQYTRLTPDQVAEIEERIASGYYTLDAIRTREKAARDEARKAKLLKLDSALAEGIKKLRDNHTFARCLVFSDIPTGAAIMYQHSKKIVFNWSTDKVTEKQFNNFVKKYGKKFSEYTMEMKKK